LEDGGGPAWCCSPPATGADGFAFVELIFARRVVAMGEVDLLMQGGTDSTSFPALQIPPSIVGRRILCPAEI